MQCKSFSIFFNKKYLHISDINVWNFKEMLTNDVVSFEQPGPDGVINGQTIISEFYIEYFVYFQVLMGLARQLYFTDWNLVKWLHTFQL